MPCHSCGGARPQPERHLAWAALSKNACASRLTLGALLPRPQTAHFCSMCGPAFCSMAAGAQIKDAALQIVGGSAEAAAAQEGMQEMSRRFREKGAELYLPAAAAKEGAHAA